ncbi:MAG: dUTP diphosphatase [Clostridium perfringens]|nr:dUTP diphosphatase [Clostridium perfringens]
MYLKDFFSHEKDLMKNIFIDKSLTSYKLNTRKHLSLQVKISNLADETKCFKYWIANDDALVSKNTVLEKYVDCLSHILSIGVDRGYDSLDYIAVKPDDYCLSDQFLNLLIDANDLIISNSMDHYKTLLEDFISLGITLGFSMSKIKQEFFQNSFCKIAL